MKRILLTISMAILSAISTNAQYDTWQTLGSADFSNGIASEPVVKVHNDTTYVAYSDASLGYKTVVKYFDGTDWVNLGNPLGVSDGQGLYLDFEFSASGIPHIAYRDNSASAAGKARVKYFDGTNWMDLGGLVSPGNVTHTNLAFNGDDVYVGYIEFWNLMEKTVKKFDGTDWVVVGNESFGGSINFELELEIDETTQTIHVTSSNFNSNAYWYSLDLNNSNDTWSSEYIEFTPNGSDRQKVVFYSGLPYIAYKDGDNQGAITVKKFNPQLGTSGAWEIIGNAAITDSISNFDFRISPSGNPTVLYNSTQNSNEKATMYQFDGTNWELIGRSNFTLNTSTSGLSFDFLSNGKPVVVYVNQGNTDELSAMTLLPCAETSHSITAEACREYSSPSGNYTWKNSGTYTDTIPNAQGCDSVITVNLSITIDTTVNQNSETLTSNCTTPNTTYQWIDCSDNSPISGATSQQYEATALGEYAVIVSNGNCTDTSACYEVTSFASINELNENQITIYPNPTKDVLFIDANHTPFEEMTIINLQGQTLMNFNSNTKKINLSNLSTGTYILIISSEGNSIHKKITKQ